jgi:pimeloyl-ACP methyl ester carboxylesterase
MHVFSQTALVAAFILTMAAHGAAAQSETLETKTKVVESLGGIPLAITHIGDASNQDVLFVHGFMSASVTWKKQLLSDLNQKFHLSALDVRGHGSSGKPIETFHYLDTRYTAADIATAIKSLDLKKPILVGHSYGGLFVMDYVRHYGTQNISGIVLVGSNGGISKPVPKQPDTPEKRARIERSRSPNIFINTQWTTAFVDGYLLGGENIETREAELLRVAAMQVPHYVRRTLRDHNTNNLDMVKSIDVPVVFLAGENHAGANKKALTFAKKQLKKAKVKTIKGQAHMAHWRAPEAFNTALLDILNDMK